MEKDHVTRLVKWGEMGVTCWPLINYTFPPQRVVSSLFPTFIAVTMFYLWLFATVAAFASGPLFPFVLLSACILQLLLSFPVAVVSLCCCFMVYVWFHDPLVAFWHCLVDLWVWWWSDLDPRTLNDMRYNEEMTEFVVAARAYWKVVDLAGAPLYDVTAVHGPAFGDCPSARGDDVASFSSGIAVETGVGLSAGDDAVLCGVAPLDVVSGDDGDVGSSSAGVVGSSSSGVAVSSSAGVSVTSSAGVVGSSSAAVVSLSSPAVASSSSVPVAVSSSGDGVALSSAVPVVVSSSGAVGGLSPVPVGGSCSGAVGGLSPVPVGGSCSGAVVGSCSGAGVDPSSVAVVVSSSVAVAGSSSVVVAAFNDADPLGAPVTGVAHHVHPVPVAGALDDVIDDLSFLFHHLSAEDPHDEDSYMAPPPDRRYQEPIEPVGIDNHLVPVMPANLAPSPFLFDHHDLTYADMPSPIRPPQAATPPPPPSPTPIPMEDTITFIPPAIYATTSNITASNIIINTDNITMPTPSPPITFTDSNTTINSDNTNMPIPSSTITSTAATSTTNTRLVICEDIPPTATYPTTTTTTTFDTPTTTATTTSITTTTTPTAIPTTTITTTTTTTDTINIATRLYIIPHVEFNPQLPANLPQLRLTPAPITTAATTTDIRNAIIPPSPGPQSPGEQDQSQDEDQAPWSEFVTWLEDVTEDVDSLEEYEEGDYFVLEQDYDDDDDVVEEEGEQYEYYDYEAF
ncbi:predicted protein [Lichtheimia corymbifera JMRC:FSU:9682]|uniref:Uncharacterized protein n=1 Tax=Lichtheimia corymbifera JMRC:FSU:9682 TaxID=1263082 RepID=A0A068SEE3_9FUNG|nr:predicted protein [Lichtheimia corymbifera JMRC:FSU:9682]